ncbi:MAG: hypothetical protein CM15mP120_21490 [Pseudomonadota bacterium]|nr:MAG: hypothetical protein CM15mP120_21490 [Pseudomonadota bacterium]
MRRNKVIQEIEARQLTEVPEFSPGDTVSVQVRVKREVVNACKPLRVSLSALRTGVLIPLLLSAKFPTALVLSEPSKPTAP